MTLRVCDQVNQGLTHGPTQDATVSRPRKFRALSGGSLSVGALALGAVAVGAMAIGAVAIGRLAIGRARIRRLEIDELTVRRLHVIEQIQAPPKSDTAS